MILLSSSLAESEEATRKMSKTFLKKFQKSLDKRKSMWYTLWAVLKRGGGIGPWKLNNEIRKGTRDSMEKIHQEEFLKVLFKQ